MPDQQPPKFVSMTQPPATAFTTKNVPAPTNLYVGDNDILRIVSQTVLNTQPFNVTYKLIRSDDGQIIIGSSLFTPPSDGSVQVFTMPLSEGFLLSVSVVPVQTGGAFRGTCFISVQIASGTGANPQTSQIICQDYISNNYGIAWPGSAIRNSLDGAGIIQAVGTANPAAGAELVVSLSAGMRWKLINLWATLTTSAAVANRLVSFGLKLGLNFQWRHQVTFFQTASQVFTYSYGPGLVTINGSETNASISSPSPTILSRIQGATSIGTSTLALDAGDQWSNIISWWEQWIES